MGQTGPCRQSGWQAPATQRTLARPQSASTPHAGRQVPKPPLVGEPTHFCPVTHGRLASQTLEQKPMGQPKRD